MTHRDRRLAAGLFVLVSTIYFATAAGITSSNDGSHFALVRALVDRHSFEISDYLEFTENQDYAFKGDLKFSDRPPGTAILAAPIYAASAFLPGPLSALRSKHDPDNPRLIYALVLPVLAASLTAIVLFWILRAYFDLSEWPSVLTVLAFAFGTMTWKYGSLLYSHAASGLVVMSAVALMLRQRRNNDRSNDFSRISRSNDFSRYLGNTDFWLGVLIGSSVLIEYTNIVFVAAAGAWQAWQIGRGPGRWRRLGFLILGGLIPAALLMAYNTLNFGGPLQLSTFNVDTSRWPQNASFLNDFATPLWVGLPAMLFYGNDNQGLFWLAPVSLLGLWGLQPLWRWSRRESALIVGVGLIMLLLFSTSTTFNPFTNDGRYLTPFLGLWFVVVGFGLESVAGAGRRAGAAEGERAASPLRWALIYGLVFLSINNQIWHIALSWGHDLNLAGLRPWAAAPENIAALWQAVLPNALNVPLWWGMLTTGWVAWRLWQEGRILLRVRRQMNI